MPATFTNPDIGGTHAFRMKAGCAPERFGEDPESSPTRIRPRLDGLTHRLAWTEEFFDGHAQAGT